jgi:hypothetical protein
MPENNYENGNKYFEFSGFTQSIGKSRSAVQPIMQSEIQTQAIRYTFAAKLPKRNSAHVVSNLTTFHGHGRKLIFPLQNRLQQRIPDELGSRLCCQPSSHQHPAQPGHEYIHRFFMAQKLSQSKSWQ